MRLNRKKCMKNIALALCAWLAVSPLPSQAAVDYAAYEQYRSGETAQENRGKVDEYITISVSTEEELKELAENCQLDSWSGDKSVKLENDIVLSEYSDIMIPSFGGIFDGGGHEISGLKLTGEGSAVGLFRYIQSGASVSNLSVSGRVEPEGTAACVGILAGVNYGRIRNCSVSGTVQGDSEVGGIAGSNAKTGEIRNSVSEASVIGNHYTGGICGSNYGILNNCTNSGNVNTYSTEVAYDLDDITVENLEDINSTTNVSAHTDSGGIAGYSEGKTYYCTNSGTVGYQHVGYNTGGIVGRLHQGYVQNCTNTGHVLGRKDVGGIIGQMEPFLEVEYLSDKLDEIDREADRFFDLMDAAQQDLSRYGRDASALNKSITSGLEEASDAAGNLLGTANELWYIYNQELTGVSDDLKRLSTDMKEQSDADKSNGNVTSITVSGNVVQIPNDTESYKAALKRFGESTGNHLGNITGATADRNGGITDNLNTMNDRMRSTADNLKQLADLLQEGTDKTGDNIDALVQQAKVLRKSITELRDDLFRYEGIEIEDTSDEAAGGDLENLGSSPYEDEAYYDTTSFQQGKVTLCINRGSVEADTNVGGVVGMISTEYDFDPEDDITFTGAESFNIEQTVKAVVRESRNLGDITGKKDYVGGIVGRAEFGAVISCEAYGKVSSTGGSYVGGIAGSSNYAVRSCYVMGELSGRNYVGGIVGKGSDVFYSYAYPRLEYTGEYVGAVAGLVEDDGTLSGNYYVEGTIGGVDSIGYEGGATPLSYEELCSREGVPEAFSEFTVTFLADGAELASYQCHYGDALTEEQIPEIPEKDGSYGVWPEFDFGFITGNKVLEAEYEKWVGSLASAETGESGKPRVLVSGEFLPDMELELTETDGSLTLAVGTRKEDGSFEEYPGNITVRALCEDTVHTRVEVADESGAYRETESRVMGSYLEFALEQPGSFRLIQEQSNDKPVIVAGICGAVGLLLLILLIGRLVKKHKGKKKSREGSE